jgi:hypothetical protein
MSGRSTYRILRITALLIVFAVLSTMNIMWNMAYIPYGEWLILMFSIATILLIMLLIVVEWKINQVIEPQEILMEAI